MPKGRKGTFVVEGKFVRRPSRFIGLTSLLRVTSTNGFETEDGTVALAEKMDGIARLSKGEAVIKRITCFQALDDGYMSYESFVQADI
jgi:hypothetical protein